MFFLRFCSKYALDVLWYRSADLIKLNDREERFIVNKIRQGPKVSISQIHPLAENAIGKRMSH